MSGQLVPRHILVMSDTEDVRLVIHDLLVEEGYRVTHHPYLTGDIATVTGASPDAIVIDCNRMDLDESVAYLRRVRQQAHLRDIPIIASTSAVRVIDRYAAEVEELHLRVLRKPFDIEILAGIVAECLSDRPVMGYPPGP